MISLEERDKITASEDNFKSLSKEPAPGDVLEGYVPTIFTMAFRQTKPEITTEIKLPKCYPTSVYNPANYSISYNDRGKEYTLVLEDLPLM